MVMVDGEIVVENGQIKACDEEALVREATDTGQKVWERFKDRHGDYVAQS